MRPQVQIAILLPHPTNSYSPKNVHSVSSLPIHDFFPNPPLSPLPSLAYTKKESSQDTRKDSLAYPIKNVSHPALHRRPLKSLHL